MIESLDQRLPMAASLVKDINTEPISCGSGLTRDSNPQLLVNVNGTLYFTANDGIHGNELWKSDGTAAGTVMVKDIFEGSVGSRVEELTNVNGTLYFRANNGINGYELWRSDGTSNNTVMVRDIWAGKGMSFPNLPNSSYPRYLTNVNGILYFNANDGINGHELWRSDGTSNNTMMVRDIWAGKKMSFSNLPNSSDPKFLTNVNGILYFKADHPHPNPDHHEDISPALWRSDGNEAGTVMVRDRLLVTANTIPRQLTNVNGTLYFQAREKIDDPFVIEVDGLWSSNGTDESTVMIKKFDNGRPSPRLEYLTNLNGTLYFQANDGTHGYELWKSSGTTAVMVEDIVRGSASSFPTNFTDVNGSIYFSASDSTNISRLWKTNGMTDGTVKVSDLSIDDFGSSLSNFANVNGTLYFSASDGIHGQGLWKSKSNGTKTDTMMVAATGYSQFLTNANGILFFSAAGDFANGRELWRWSDQSTPNKDVSLQGTSCDDRIIARYTGDGSQHAWEVTRGTTILFRGPILNDGSLVIDGLSGTDALVLVGSTNADNIQLEANRAIINGATIQFTNIGILGILGIDGNDELTVLAAAPTGLSRLFDGGTGTDSVRTVSGNNTFTVTNTGAGNINSIADLSYTTIESLIGGTGNDQFIFTNTGNLEGPIVGGGGTDAINLAAKTTEQTVNLQLKTATSTGGFDGIESFIGSSTATVTDVLIGTNSSTTWTIDGVNSGSISGAFTGSVSFRGFESLTGGTAADTFTFTAAGSLSKTLNGGTATGVVNIVNLSAKPGALDFQLNTTNGLPGTIGNYTGIEQINGNSIPGSRVTRVNNTTTAWVVNESGQIVVSGVTYSGVGSIVGNSGSLADTLSGPAVPSTWLIDSANGGTLTVSGSTVSFSGIENLTGSTAADTFILGKSGNLSGTINGGDGTGVVDTLDLTTKSNAFDFHLNKTNGLPGTIGIYTGIERIIFKPGAGVRLSQVNNAPTAWVMNSSGQIIVNGVAYSGVRSINGGPGLDTFTGPAVDSTWTIDAENGGSITIPGASINFSGMENLTGGTGNDQFVFGVNGSLKGAIIGGTGKDTVNFAAKTIAHTVNLQLNTATSTGGVSGIESFIGSGSATVTDVLIGTNTDTNWTVSGANSGSLTSSPTGAVSFTGFESLTGGTAADTFTFTRTGSISKTLTGGTAKGVIDKLDLSAKSGALDFRLDATTNTVPGAILGNYTGIEQITSNSVAGSKVTRVNNIAATWSVNTSGQIIVDSVSYSGVRSIAGGQGADTIVGPAVDSTWTLNATNGGSLAIPGSTIGFTGVENVTGGTASDTFIVLSGGSLTGNLHGGTGTAINSLSYSTWTKDVKVNLSVTSSANATSIAGLTSNIQMVTGGSGNDTLTGQLSKATILIGLAGSDTLVGGSQRDLLFGGTGRDTIQGKGGDDLIISGRTAFDTNRAALLSLYNEWTSVRTFAQRTANIWGNGAGTRSNGDKFLNNNSADSITNTVFADSDVDRLTGGTNQDWFFALASEVTDFLSSGTAQDRRN